MPKNRVVASFVGNFSPVKSSTASLVSRVRHRRGDMGEELKSRAEVRSVGLLPKDQGEPKYTILEDRSPIQLEAGVVGILVLLCVTHCESGPAVYASCQSGFKNNEDALGTTTRVSGSIRALPQDHVVENERKEDMYVKGEVGAWLRRRFVNKKEKCQLKPLQVAGGCQSCPPKFIVECAIKPQTRKRRCLTKR